MTYWTRVFLAFLGGLLLVAALLLGLDQVVHDRLGGGLGGAAIAGGLGLGMLAAAFVRPD